MTFAQHQRAVIDFSLTRGQKPLYATKAADGSWRVHRWIVPLMFFTGIVGRAIEAATRRA
jgi:hypothetical protein